MFHARYGDDLYPEFLELEGHLDRGLVLARVRYNDGRVAAPDLMTGQRYGGGAGQPFHIRAAHRTVRNHERRIENGVNRDDPARPQKISWATSAEWPLPKV